MLAVGNEEVEDDDVGDDVAECKVDDADELADDAPELDVEEDDGVVDC